MANVIFRTGTRAQYDALATKDANTLYWLTDTQELFKGEALFGKGANATAQAAGLLSPEDKIKLDSITEAGIFNLIPVDASVVIADSESGKTIGVQISKDEGNALSLHDDGLFATISAESVVPEYAIERQEIASDGYVATYKLKKTANGESVYIGDEINIPKDLVIKSGTVEIADIVDVPYTGAAVGDPYIDLVLNNDETSHIYIPVKGLVDTYTAGQGIEIAGNVVSVKIDVQNANGLMLGENGIGIAIATSETAGVISAEDKAKYDAAAISVVWQNM